MPKAPYPFPATGLQSSVVLRASRHTIRLVALVAVLAAASIVPAEARTGAGNGQAIARQWCAKCHIVAADQKTAVEGVPSFKSIGERLSDDQIRAALFAPHPPMPNFEIHSESVDALIAYIRRQAHDTP